ncbi:hypothetical protein ECG_01974 [Echinococcus granulosus]|nr:hypothetical protein ECG_01974 [Echinococcus granulosus]
MLASHNYASCLVVCAALVGAGEAEQQLADQQPRGSDKNVEGGPEKTAAPDVLQSSLESLRCRIKHLQDMVIFNRCLASFRRCYNLPRWTPRAYSVRHVFQRGSDHFTSEFARCLAGSQLKGSEVLAIYRGFVAETATNEFVVAIGFIAADLATEASGRLPQRHLQCGSPSGFHRCLPVLSSASAAHAEAPLLCTRVN